MSTAQLFTSCSCVSATAFDLQCRCVLALYQNANYILFTGAQHDVPVLTVDWAKSVHDFNSLIYHAVLASDGWLGSKHISSLKIWSLISRRKWWLKKKGSLEWLFGEGMSMDTNRQVNDCEMKARFIKEPKTHFATAIFNLCLDSQKYIGNQSKVQSCGDSPDGAEMSSPGPPGKWDVKEKLV